MPKFVDKKSFGLGRQWAAFGSFSGFWLTPPDIDILPPLGFVFLVDSDGYHLLDTDGYYLVEAL